MKRTRTAKAMMKSMAKAIEREHDRMKEKGKSDALKFLEGAMKFKVARKGAAHFIAVCKALVESAVFVRRAEVQGKHEQDRKDAASWLQRNKFVVGLAQEAMDYWEKRKGDFEDG